VRFGKNCTVGSLYHNQFKGPYRMRDYLTKANEGGIADSITATKLGAGEANSFLTELKTVVSSSGQTLANAAGTSEVSDQLAKSLAVYGAGGGGYCIDTGSANAYVLDPVSPKKAAPALFDGLTLSFVPGNANTGAATINYNSLGTIAIKKMAGFSLVGGELPAYVTVTVRYDSINAYFEIISPLLLTGDQTFSVGSGGNFTTISSALSFLSKFKPTHKLDGVNVTLNLLAGYIMAEQITCDAANYGWINIIGADSETVIDHSGFIVVIGGVYPAFTAIHGGMLPVISQMFRFSGGASSNIGGVYVRGAGSKISVTSSAGIADAGGNGITILNGATATLTHSDFSGAGSYGLYAAQNANVDAPYTNVTGCGGSAIYASENCNLNVSSSTATNSGNIGLYATKNCMVNAISINVSGATNEGIYADSASIINAPSVTMTSIGGIGIYADNASTINAAACNINGCGINNIAAVSNSTINVDHGTSINATLAGIYAYKNSMVNAEGITITSCLTDGVQCFSGSSVNIVDSAVTGSGGTDIKVQNGSVVSANGTTYTTTNLTPNTISGNGILFV
jgi:hypothetical protein